MLIRIFTRYYKLIILILIPISVQAEERDLLIIGFNNSIISEIDNSFLTQPTKKNAVWLPKIKGKSKYAFNIPKNAFLISKNYADASDLFYLSEQTDNGLKIQSNKSKNIDIVISENNSNFILSQSILSNINAGLFLNNKENISFGVNFNKDVILSKNALGNFGIKLAKDEYIIFNTSFVKLTHNENSEFHGNINHKFRSDHLNVGIGNTWFDIANQFDLTVGIHEQNKKVESEIYATFGDENIIFEVGLNQLKDSSNMNIFFSLKLENTLDKRNFGSNVIITSKERISSLKKLSLKSFRKKNLDILWKKHMNYN